MNNNKRNINNNKDNEYDGKYNNNDLNKLNNNNSSDKYKQPLVLRYLIDMRISPL